MKTAIIYSRVSTKEQANEKQVEQLTDYCLRNGYQIIATKEEKISGAASEKEVLDGIINGEPMADYLVIREISRLSRQEDVLESAMKVREIVKKYTLVIVADNYVIEKGTKIGEDLEKLLIIIVRLFGAADERKKIAMRTSEARKKYAANPENYASGSIPFGMEKVDNPNYVKGINTKSIIRPGKDFETVIQIYRLKAAGLSYTQVAMQVGLEVPLVRNILRNSRVQAYLPEGLADTAFEASKRNNSAPSPSKHKNIYKGLIFDGDTDYQMKHQATSKGNRYIKDGKGCITEKDLNETVLKALQSFVRRFRISKNDVVAKNEQEIKRLKMAVESSKEALTKKQDELKTLERKAVNTANLGLYEAIQRQIVKVDGEIRTITANINGFVNRISELESLGFEPEVVTEENLETYVNQYVKAIRYYPVKKFCRIIRIEIKEEYLPEGANNYKEYEVYSCREKRYIIPLDLKYANNMLEMKGIDSRFEDDNDCWNVGSGYYDN